jgi:uncharacterized protein (DUF1778 family)
MRLAHGDSHRFRPAEEERDVGITLAGAAKLCANPFGEWADGWPEGPVYILFHREKNRTPWGRNSAIQMPGIGNTLLRCQGEASDRMLFLISEKGHMYYLNTYNSRKFCMPRVTVEDDDRMSMRVRAEERAMLLRAAALENTGLTDFVLQHALHSAKVVIEEAGHVRLSERDSFRILKVLENPPRPNARLKAAARALSDFRDAPL